MENYRTQFIRTNDVTTVVVCSQTV